VITTLLELVRLKQLARSGWLRIGVSRPESVAGHSWGVAWLTLLLLPDSMNRERALSYALIHDMPEVRVGDLTPYDGVAVEEKVQRERVAMAGLCAELPEGDRLVNLWESYAQQSDEEARFVRQLDRLDMALQAVSYAQEGHDVREFMESALRHIEHPMLLEIMEALSVELAQIPRTHPPTVPHPKA
jgi:putative hydrolase of HD superfamily